MTCGALAHAPHTHSLWLSFAFAICSIDLSPLLLIWFEFIKFSLSAAACARTHAHSVKQRNDLLCAATCKSIKVLTLFLFTFRFDIGIVVVAIHDCANIYILFVLIAVLLTSFLSLCVRFSVCSFQIAIFPIEHIHELGRSYVWDVCLSGRASEWTNKHMCKDKRCWARAI